MILRLNNFLNKSVLLTEFEYPELICMRKTNLIRLQCDSVVNSRDALEGFLVKIIMGNVNMPQRKLIYLLPYNCRGVVKFICNSYYMRCKELFSNSFKKYIIDRWALIFV